MPTIATQRSASSDSFRLVAQDGRELLLEQQLLRARAGGGLCRVRLEQTFSNPYNEPLTLTYVLPLPADSAVKGFAFRIGDRRVEGEIDRRVEARERFEQALVEGRTAALLEQDRSSLFTQEIGNVPPGATVVAEIEVDQPLQWVGQGAAAGQWEWRFPTTVAPRYLGAPGRVADGDRIGADVRDGGTPPRLRLDLRVLDPLTGPLRSPSHEVFERPVEGGAPGAHAGLVSENGAGLDRDVVVRWPAAQANVGARLEVVQGQEPGAEGHGLLTLVPSVGEGDLGVSRDVTILLDTSGSMSGEPLDQARAVVCALVESLGDRDRLEMIEFSSQPRRWKRRSRAMKPRHKADALAWLRALRAGGGTEMHSAILESAKAPATDGQRQIVLVTDGLIGFEQEIVAAILDTMPSSSRFHAVAVGSAPNRSLTQAAARAGRGIERGIQLGDDPAPLAAELVARTSHPQVVDVQLSGSAFVESAPERMPDLFAGAPARIALRLRPEGGELIVRGRRADGPWEQRIAVDGTLDHSRDEIATWFGRERVEDLEMRVARGEALDEAIETVALRYRIASRMTSWIAVDTLVRVDPGAPVRKEKVPHELPMGLSVEGLGLRPAVVEGAPAKPRSQSAIQSLPSAAPIVVEDGVYGAGAGPLGAVEGALPPARSRGVGRRKSKKRAPPAPPKVGRIQPSPRQDADDMAEESVRPDSLDSSSRDLIRKGPPLYGVGGDPSAGPDGTDAVPLSGRVVRLPNGSWVVEFPWNVGELPQLWSVPDSVWLAWGQGAGELGDWLATSLVPGSTGGGLVPPSAVVRLVLSCEGLPSELPQRAAFCVAGQWFVVTPS